MLLARRLGPESRSLLGGTPPKWQRQSLMTDLAFVFEALGSHFSSQPHLAALELSPAYTVFQWTWDSYLSAFRTAAANALSRCVL